MKYTRAIFAGVCFLVVSGAIDAARADDRAKDNDSVTLYTGRGLADRFGCSAVNVSDKTLSIAFAILDNDGKALSCDSPTTCFDKTRTATTNPTPEFSVPPGTVAELNITAQPGSLDDGYCMAAVSGTGNRNDLRVSLLVGLTTTIPGTTTPTFVSRVWEGH